MHIINTITYTVPKDL